jgi:hypothetical protein
MLEPGERRTIHVEIGVLDSEEEIDLFVEQMKPPA